MGLISFLDLLYPRRCPLCGGIVMPKGAKACSTCTDKVKAIREPRCKNCSQPIDDEEAEYCYDCSIQSHSYDMGYAMWLYDKRMKQSIYDFKYKGRREYAAYYIEEMVKQYGDWIRSNQTEVIIPVPLHKSKLCDRGFNQAEILARGLGAQLDIWVEPQALLRKRKTSPQKELDDRERRKNLSQVFELSSHFKSQIQGLRTVLLVDDIYTTGSTIDACARVLKKAGIKEVYFLTICIGKGI